MSKLAILVPHYKESEEEIKPLLDSIEHQINVKKDDFEVIIGNDGDEVLLSIDFLKQYHFRIQYHVFEHSRLAGCRKNLFEVSNAEYIMFCDADDRFISEIAFSLIFNFLNEIDLDGLICAFLEEHVMDDGKIIYIQRNNDTVFVHGKVWRSSYLREHHIEWDPSLHEHQDSAFNVLARILTKKLRHMDIPIYLWHDNPNSISRRNGIYHLPNTWPHMIDSYQSIINNLKERGLGHLAAYYTQYCLYSTYYEMAHDIWHSNKVDTQKINTYKRIVEFYNTNFLLLKYYDKKNDEGIIQVTEGIAKKKGHMNDMPPFEEWLTGILKLF